jgi:hypothetical protein
MTKKDSRLDPKTEFILVPVVDAPEMEEVMNLLKVRCCCGTCNEVGCSWCNASVPRVQDAPKKS